MGEQKNSRVRRDIQLDTSPFIIIIRTKSIKKPSTAQVIGHRSRVRKCLKELRTKISKIDLYIGRIYTGIM